MPHMFESKYYGRVLAGGDIIPSPGFAYVINKNNKIVLGLDFMARNAYNYAEYIPFRRNRRNEWVNCSGEYTWSGFKRKLLDDGIRFKLKGTKSKSILINDEAYFIDKY